MCWSLVHLLIASALSLFSARPNKRGQTDLYATKVQWRHHWTARKHQVANGGAGKTVRQSSTTGLCSAWLSTLNRPQVAIG